MLLIDFQCQEFRAWQLNDCWWLCLFARGNLFLICTWASQLHLFVLDVLPGSGSQWHVGHLSLCWTEGVQSPAKTIEIACPMLECYRKADVAMSTHTMNTPSTYRSNKNSQVELWRNPRAPLSYHVCRSAATTNHPTPAKKWRPPSACVYHSVSLVIVSRTPPMSLATSAPWVDEEINSTNNPYFPMRLMCWREIACNRTWEINRN